MFGVFDIDLPEMPGQASTTTSKMRIAAKKCLPCVNSYTLKNNTFDDDRQECDACPEEAMARNADSIVLREGTWRYDYYTTTILECPMYDSCQGGATHGNDSCLSSSYGPTVWSMHRRLRKKAATASAATAATSGLATPERT